MGGNPDGDANWRPRYRRPEAVFDPRETEAGPSEEREDDVYLFDSPEAAVRWMNKRFALVLVGDKDRVLRDAVDPESGCTDYQFLTRDAVSAFLRNRRWKKPSASGVEYVPIYAVWLNHEKRRTFDRIVFAPEVRVVDARACRC